MRLKKRKMQGEVVPVARNAMVRSGDRTEPPEIVTETGKAVLLVSSELPELIGMSDRILMLHDARIAGEFTRAEATPEKLMAAAMGQSTSHADNPHLGN